MDEQIMSELDEIVTDLSRQSQRMESDSNQLIRSMEMNKKCIEETLRKVVSIAFRMKQVQQCNSDGAGPSGIVQSYLNTLKRSMEDDRNKKMFCPQLTSTKELKSFKFSSTPTVIMRVLNYKENDEIIDITLVNKQYTTVKCIIYDDSKRADFHDVMDKGNKILKLIGLKVVTPAGDGNELDFQLCITESTTIIGFPDTTE